MRDLIDIPIVVNELNNRKPPVYWKKQLKREIIVMKKMVRTIDHKVILQA